MAFLAAAGEDTDRSMEPIGAPESTRIERPMGHERTADRRSMFRLLGTGGNY